MKGKKPYRAINDYWRERFGERVQKISIDAGFTCPNRDGSKATGGCIYCNNDSFNFSPKKPVPQQIAEGIERARRRYGARKFIAYFQAYSNTYASPDFLYDTYSTIRAFPEIVGLSIGTRPDCVPEPVLQVIQQFVPTHEVWVEYGLESSNDDTLRRINRAHTFAEFVDAVARTEGRGMRIAAHIITGFPWESREVMVQTGRDIARLPMDALKIHNLHIVRGTALETLHARSPYRFLSMNDYAEIVADILELLPSDLILMRLTAECPEELLVAPEWTNRKTAILDRIHRILAERNSFQGSKHELPTASTLTG